MLRILLYQNLLMRWLAAPGRAQFSQPWMSVEQTQTRKSRPLMFRENLRERQIGFNRPCIFVASAIRRTENT